MTPDQKIPQADPWADLGEWTVQILDELRSLHECRTYRADAVDAARATVESQVAALSAALLTCQQALVTQSDLLIRERAEHAEQLTAKDAEIARLKAHATLRAAITKASEAWAHAKASTAGTDVVVNSQEAVLIDAALSPQEPV